MKILSIEIIGFKSFYEKTAIRFHPGINAVVGPNGCGKSNIIDAVRWAFGEQNPRRLRAEDMADVISNGGESLKPLGMAEVSLTIGGVPKAGFDEIRITRRLFRSGESEYYINGAPCRLRDIAETFMDTGSGARAHSIIGQGRIEHLITAKPEDRRTLIEEAGGIVRYKARRRETESQIEATRENLKRARDIMNESLRRKQALSRQAEDALRHGEVQERARRIEIALLGSRLEILRGRRQSISDGMNVATGNLARLRREDEDASRAISALDGEVAPIHSEIEALEQAIRQTKSDLESNASRKRVLLGEAAGTDEFLAKLEKEIRHLRGELENLKSRRTQRLKDLNQAERLTSEKENEIRERERALASQRSIAEEERKELDRRRRTLLQILDRRSSLRAATLASEREAAELRKRFERGRREIAETEGECERISRRRGELRQAIEAAGAQIADIRERDTERQSDLSRMRANIAARKEGAKTLHGRLGEAASRLGALRRVAENYEWLPAETRAFLSERRDTILGLAADFIAPRKGYERAVEAALGERLKWAVVNRDEDALRALESLREANSGRCAFVSIESLSADGIIAHENLDGMTPLSQFVEAEGVDKSAILGILSGIYVVSSPDEAVKMRRRMRNGASFVTAEGEFLDPQGAISGGAPKYGILSVKSEIRELTENISSLKEAHDAISAEIERDQAEIRTREATLEKSAAELRELEIKSAGVRKDIANSEENLAKAFKRRDIIRFEFDGAASEIERVEEKLRQSRTDEENLRGDKDRLEEEFKRIQERVGKRGEEEKSVEAEITAAKVRHASLAAERKNCLAEIRELEGREIALDGKIALEESETRKKTESKATAIKNVEGVDAALESLARALSEQEAAHGELKSRRELLIARVNSAAEKKNGVLKSIRAEEEQSRALEASIREIEIEAAHLRDAGQKFGMTEAAEAGIAPEIAAGKSADIQQLETELQSLKAEIGKLGLVNLLAPEEFREQAERYNFLSAQTEDLEAALTSLKKAMSRIDRESEKRFKETFDAVNKKFGELFGSLFDGGEAKLILTDSDDTLHTGVDVIARPKGKRLQAVNLLSGGEKALSAIALVISACFVRATPFLILDEIDAPLDDANTRRFTELLRKIAKDSQIIIVSHNKTTMQAVDSLIGITSAKPGATKVVSVELTGV